MAVWSASLPQDFMVDGYQEQWADNLIVQEMDAGPPKVRRRQTAAVEKINCYQFLTKAQVATLKTWWISTITGGSTAFDLPHPRTGSTVSAMLLQPPVPSAVDPNTYRVSYVFTILP